MAEVMDYRTLKGPQKAAIFMLAVGDQHAAKLFLNGFSRVAGDLECLVHYLRLVIPDRPGGQLDPIADDVILPAEDVQRILGLQSLQPALGHGATLEEIFFHATEECDVAELERAKDRL